MCDILIYDEKIINLLKAFADEDYNCDYVLELFTKPIVIIKKEVWIDSYSEVLRMPINEFVEKEKWKEFCILDYMKMTDDGLELYVQ